MIVSVDGRVVSVFLFITYYFENGPAKKKAPYRPVPKIMPMAIEGTTMDTCKVPPPPYPPVFLIYVIICVNCRLFGCNKL